MKILNRTIYNKKLLNFDDVRLLPRHTQLKSRKNVCLSVCYPLKYSPLVLYGIPVMCSNMTSIASFKMAKILCKEYFFTCLHKYYTEQEILDNFDIELISRVFYTVGLKEEETKRFESLVEKCYISKLLIDIANGYLQIFLDKIKYFRDKYPNLVIMAGNVCTAEGCEKILKAGADLVKCGIAGGSVCDTSKKAGVGFPQLSMIEECLPAIKENKGLMVSDGGIKYPADISKALASGAHFVMCGKLFAGYDENDPDEIISKEILTGEFGRDINNNVNELKTEKKNFMRFYGMSSKYANDKYNGGLKDYRTSEGNEILIEMKGSVKELLLDIKGSLASTCTYLDCETLQYIANKAEFIQV